MSFEALKEGKAFLHILHREGLVHKNKFQSKSINHQMDYSYDRKFRHECKASVVTSVILTVHCGLIMPSYIP